MMALLNMNQNKRGLNIKTNQFSSRFYTYAHVQVHLHLHTEVLQAHIIADQQNDMGVQQLPLKVVMI